MRPCFFLGPLNLPWNLTYPHYHHRVYKYHAVGTQNCHVGFAPRTRDCRFWSTFFFFFFRKIDDPQVLARWLKWHMWQFPKKVWISLNCYHEYIADGETQFGFSDDSSSSWLFHVSFILHSRTSGYCSNGLLLMKQNLWWWNHGSLCAKVRRSQSKAASLNSLSTSLRAKQ